MKIQETESKASKCDSSGSKREKCVRWANTITVCEQHYRELNTDGEVCYEIGWLGAWRSKRAVKRVGRPPNFAGKWRQICAIRANILRLIQRVCYAKLDHFTSSSSNIVIAKSFVSAIETSRAVRGAWDRIWKTVAWLLLDRLPLFSLTKTKLTIVE